LITGLAAVAVAAGAVVQAITGLGFSLVCAPFLIALAGSRDGVRLNLILSATINLAYLLPERTTARVPDVVRLLIPAMVTTVATAYVVHRIDEDPLAVAAGVITVAAALALLVGIKVRQPHVVLAGGLSGITNTIAGIGGPAIAVYAVGAGWPGIVRRPTFQLYFLGLNIVGLVALGFRWPPALLWIALGIGWLLGRLLSGRVSEEAARTATLAVAVAGGAVAVARGLL
jgi:uncharacterized membrane protein YfcA